MANIEKVIKGLEVCTSRPCFCKGCPYVKDCVLDSQEVMEDALELLKEYSQHLQNDLETLKEQKRELEFELELMKKH